MTRKDHTLIAKAINNARIAMLRAGLLQLDDWEIKVIANEVISTLIGLFIVELIASGGKETMEIMVILVTVIGWPIAALIILIAGAFLIKLWNKKLWNKQV